MGHLMMSEKERQRKVYMEMVRQRKLTLVKAAEQLMLSYRQTKRVYRRYLEQGDAGLIHKSRGCQSNRNHPHRQVILERYKERYEGFGPTLAAEKLAEVDDWIVDHDTLRRWLLAEGLWHKQRKRSPYRQQRKPREQFGELVQIDGSIHDWFENGCQDCLLNMVDDATSKTLARLDTGETTAVVLNVLWRWIALYGIPMALYVDLKSVYVSPKDGGFSHVEKACAKLGIQIIKAYSPQAKGRVERKHAVYQDRFVKELRLQGIKTIEQANQLLDPGFTDKLNQKFEKPARKPQSAHRPVKRIDLNQILCWEYQRQVQNDWTFSFRGQCYQIKKPYGCAVRPKVKIHIRRHLDNSVSAWYKNHKLPLTAIEKRPQKQQKTLKSKLSQSDAGRRAKLKSPWNQFNPNWLKNNKSIRTPSAI